MTLRTIRYNFVSSYIRIYRIKYNNHRANDHRIHSKNIHFGFIRDSYLRYTIQTIRSYGLVYKVRRLGTQTKTHSQHMSLRRQEMANTPLNIQSLKNQINDLEQQLNNLKGNSTQTQLLRTTGQTHIKMLQRRIKSAERRHERRANMTEADRQALKAKRDKRRAETKRLVALGRLYEQQRTGENATEISVRPN